jgi:3-hydroxy-3-methylglutaryl CoA synthase
MIASYGSGNTMIVIAGRVAPRAPEIIESWNLGGLFSGSHNASFEEYEKWLQAPYPATEPGSRYSVDEVPAGSYYLKNIREDGYREYAFKE